MFVTINPAATFSDGLDFAVDVNGPQRQKVEIRKGAATEVPDWVANPAGLLEIANVVECDEAGVPLEGGGA